MDLRNDTTAQRSRSGTVSLRRAFVTSWSANLAKRWHLKRHYRTCCWRLSLLPLLSFAVISIGYSIPQYIGIRVPYATQKLAAYIAIGAIVGAFLLQLGGNVPLLAAGPSAGRGRAS